MNKIVSQLPAMTKSPAKIAKRCHKTALTALALALTTHHVWAVDDFAQLPTIKRPLPSNLPAPLPVTQPAPVATAPTIARPRPNLLAVDHLAPAIARPVEQPNINTQQATPNVAIDPQINTTPIAVAKTSIITPPPMSATPPTVARHAGQMDPLQALSRFYHEPATCQGQWVYPIIGQLSNDGTVQALADRGYYDSKNTALLSGRVVLSQYQRQLRADSVSMDTNTGETYAKGAVAFGGVDEDLLGVADQLRYNTQTGQAIAHDVAFASKSMHAHGTAKQLTHQTGRYDMAQATFSTCPPTQRLWQLQAKNISLDAQSGRGIAKNATLRIKDTPILYLPYFNFPLDKRRTSGFLLPKVGLDSKGLQLSTPYYFNIAPNYDATLTPTIYSDRYPRLVAEGRYLNAKLGTGVLELGYLPKDKQRQNQDRYHVFATHKAETVAGRNLSAFANYRRVSDGHYLSDFDRLGVGSSPLNLPSELGVAYQNDRLDLNLKAQVFQRLAGVDRTGAKVLDKNRPYERLPQLSASYRLPEGYLPWGINAHAISHAAYFKKHISDGSDSEKSGVRAYNRLNVSYSLVRPYGYITPYAAITQLYAGFDEKSLLEQQLTKDDGVYHVVVPSVGVDSGLVLQKAGSPFGFFGNEGYQLLTPRLKYVYHQQKDQSKFPNFDTKMAAMSYHQLLADSWFLGYDRVSDLHALTPALGYRYMDKTGRTRLDMALAEQFYLRDGAVSLGATDGFKKGRSGMAWQLSASPSERLWVDASGAFDHDHRFNAATLALRLEPKPKWLFGLGVVERRADPRLGQLPLSAYTASAMFPVGERWQVMATGQYDRKYKGAMDMLAGVTYQDCCIGVTVYGRQYRNELQPSEINRAVMAEVSLTGLGGSGRLARLLKERVLGLGTGFY